LRLLDPGSGLTLVRLEGLNPADATDDDDRFLGCDLSEYYRGQTVEAAARLVVTQLKYSVEYPKRAWTVARLAKRTRGLGTSVAARFAQAFKGLVDDHGVDTVLAKVTIALVSNQPVDGRLADALETAQGWLASRPSGISFAQLLGGPAGPYKDQLEKLKNATGLGSSLFTDYLRVIDLSGCGARSRALQTLALASEVGAVTAVTDTRPGVVGLTGLVRNQMLPETAESAGLTRTHVIVALGASGESALFPYPAKIRPPTDPVKTSQADVLARNVRESGTHRVLAHGGPGVGKTTTLTALETALPDGSVVVLYDCFANNDFRSPAEDRHSARATVQIANDIAIRVGAMPVIVPDTPVSDSELWRRLMAMIETAAATLPEHALLVIAVDAADNAVYAAQQAGTRPFVDAFWRLPLPANVRLVMTGRTGRRQDVLRDVPGIEIDEVELSPFDVEASSQMLRSRYPDASGVQCAAFHDASGGVARVQVYALEEAGSDPVGDAVTLAAQGLGAIFDEIISTAMSSVVDPEAHRQRIAALAVMSHPVRADILAGALSASAAEITELVAGLGQTVRADESGIGFADEDFTNHLRDIFSGEEKRAAHAMFADYCMSRRSDDPDAAWLAGEHLYHAGCGNDLIALVLDEGPPAVITDGFARAQAFQGRVRLALHAASAESPAGVFTSAGNVVKLLLAAGDAARADTSLTDTIRTAPDLAVQHADAAAVAEVVGRDETRPWSGRTYFHTAAILACDPQQHDHARDALLMARAWLQARQRAPRHERWELNADDIAQGVLGALAVEGVESAVMLATGWRPVSFVEQVTAAFFVRAPRRVDLRLLRRVFEDIRAGSWVAAACAAAYADSGEPVPARWVSQIAARLDLQPVHPTRRAPSWGLEFCELALTSGVSRHRVRRLLTRLVPPLSGPARALVSAESLRRPLAAAVLAAVLDGQEPAAESLMPEDVQDSGAHDKALTGEQARLWTEAVRRLLPVLTARARCLTASARQGAAAAAAAVAAVSEGLHDLMEESSRRFYHPGPLQGAWLRAAMDALIAATQVSGGSDPSPAEEMLATLADVAAQALGQEVPEYWVDRADRLLTCGVAREFALGLLGRAADETERVPRPAVERRDILLAAARAAQSEKPLAADLFGRAVHAATGIDTHVSTRLRAILEISSHIKRTETEESRRQMANRLLAALQDAASYVPEGEHLPHRLALITAAELDPRYGLAAAFRWGDEERFPLHSALSAVLPVVGARRVIPPADLIWLLRLFDPYADLVPVAQSLLCMMTADGPVGRQRATCSLDALAEWAVRDIAWGRQAKSARRLSAAARKCGLGATASVRKLVAFADTWDSLIPPQESQLPELQHSGAAETEIDELIRRASTQTAEVDLMRIRQQTYRDKDTVSYLIALARSVGTRADGLDALLSLADGGIQGVGPEHIAAAIRGLLDGWRDTLVRAWARSRLPTWVTRHLPDLMTWATGRDGQPESALQLPDDPEHLISAVVAGTAASLAGMSAADLYTIAVTVCQASDGGSLAEVVEWALDRGTDAASTGTRNHQIPHPLPHQTHELLAAALWPLLEHADTWVRWRAAHTVRLLLTHGPGPLLASSLWHLATGSTDSDPSNSFRSAALEPLTLTGLQWLLLALDRTAHDAPDTLTPIAADIASCATSSQLPHAAVRELARRTALTVAAALPETLPGGTIARLAFANTPDRCSIQRGHGRDRNEREAGDSRFSFNQMDTIPYWYAPLARVFDSITTADVAQRADEWITDRWGRTDEDTWNDLRAANNEHRWELTSNTQGQLPAIDTLETYLEFHAMQLAAGQLADSGTPMLIESFNDAPDPWQEWLARYLPQSRSRWRADLRQPAPLRPLTLGAWDQLAAGPADQRASGASPRPVAVAACTAIRDLSDDPAMTIVAASVTADRHDLTVYAWLTSALVTPSAADALLAALATSPNPFSLPYAADTHPQDHHIDVPGLQLLGWLTEENARTEGIDASDPLSVRITGHPVLPAPGFLTWAGLAPGRAGDSYSGPAGSEMVTTCAWGSEETRLRVTEPAGANGRYTAIHRELLRSYLRYRGLSLIIATRSMAGKSRSALASRMMDAARYTIVHADGTERSVNASH
jgi:hypothetical protein